MFSALRSVFGKKSVEPFAVPKQNSLMRKLEASELLTPYQNEIDEIREMVGVTPEHFDLYYYKPIYRYAELIQLSPASELHHHSHAGGMLEHNLDVVINALRIRRGQILPPGIDAEDIERKKDIWTYAVFVAALMHDIGKLITDLYFVDPKGRPWTLMSNHSLPDVYEVRYNKHRVHKLHERLPMLVLHRFIDENAISWLFNDALVFQNLVYFLSGDHGNTPIISEIVQKADQLSVVQNLGGDVKQVAASTQQRPLHERFLHTIQTLLSEDALPLNRKGAAGYTHDNLIYFVSKRLLDEVKGRMRKDGQSVPGRNDRLMDELQQFKVIISNGDRAIWRCRVQIEDWEQTLTMLCFDVSKVWPSLDDRPEVPSNQAVEPVESSSVASNEKSCSKEGGEEVKINYSEPVKLKDEPKRNRVTKKAVKKSNEAITESLALDNELTELDGLLDSLESREQPNDLIGDYSEFSDEDVMAYESTDASFDAGVVEPEKSRNKQQSESKEELLEEIKEAASKGRSNTVAYHNSKVAEQAGSLIEFDDPNCPAAQFISWLVGGISSGKIPVNAPANQVHFVNEGLFMVSPAIFKTFERDTRMGWQVAQRDLTKKKINLKTQKGENIFQYEISSKSGRNSPKVIKGILIPNFEKIGLKSSRYNEYLRAINE